jgi:SAM-dependent methyltransferase
MSIVSNDSKNLIISLSEWFHTPPGSYARTWEQERLAELTADIFGYNAVQLGMPEMDTLAANRMPNRWLTDSVISSGAENNSQSQDDEARRQVVLLHDYAELPFASQSLDLVVLPHVLEFAAEPHHVLREVERVLIPEGQVIICGFNPVSLWGARQIFGRVTGAHFLPVHGEFISVPRLKDWLKLLNMEINRGHFGCYAPPCDTSKWLQRFGFLEKAGNRWWPYLGALYMVQAIKRVQGMRLVGPAWQKHSARVRSVVPATNHMNNKQTDE